MHSLVVVLLKEPKYLLAYMRNGNFNLLISGKYLVS